MTKLGFTPSQKVFIAKFMPNTKTDFRQKELKQYDNKKKEKYISQVLKELNKTIKINNSLKVSQYDKKLLRKYNKEGLPDFRSIEWKLLTLEEKEDYIYNEIQIAKENRSNKKNEIKDYIKDYIKIDVKDLKQFKEKEKDINSDDYNAIEEKENEEKQRELYKYFYDIYKTFKGSKIIFRYFIKKKLHPEEVFDFYNFIYTMEQFEKLHFYNNIEENTILASEIINIPSNNFSKWWKDYSAYGISPIQEGSSEGLRFIKEITISDFQGTIIIYKLDVKEDDEITIKLPTKKKLGNQPLREYILKEKEAMIQKQDNIKKKDEENFIKQFFKEHPISNCLLQPIKDWAINCRNNAQSKTTYYRYNKMENDINNYIDMYINSGVPQDEIINICNKLQIDISIGLPLQKENKLLEVKSDKKPLRTFNFINTKFNHIDLNEITYENNIIKLDNYKELIKIKNQLENDDKFFMYKMNNGKYSCLITLEGKYIVKNDMYETFKNFEIETGLNNCKICDIENYELSKFVRDGCHYTGNMKFTNEINEDLNIKHIDMEKAYASFKKCNYYNGFLGKITDFRKTNKIMGVGLYQVDNINFSQAEEKIKKLLLKLNIYHNKYIYTSQELYFLRDNNITYDIISGCWGSVIDFEFNKDMLNTKTEQDVPYYSHYCGFINSQFLNTNYFLKSCHNYSEILKYKNCYDGITYLRENDETIITIKKKNNYHLSHINAFITSYQRLNLIEQLLEIDLNKIIKINLDGIYYYDSEIKLKNSFRYKEYKSLSLLDYPKSLIPLFDTINDYKYSNIEVDENFKNKLNLGCGGSGKTTKELRDDGYINKLFCPPSWKLARNKENEEGVNVSVWYYITTKDPEIRNKILKKYNVLIIDEVSMMTEETKKFILEEFKLCKIIFCGDLGYQLPPIKDKEMTTEGIEKIEYFNNNYRCKCPKLLELLNKCREMIKDKKELIFINNYIINFFKKENRILNIEELKKNYEINDMILCGTNEIKNFYTDIFKGKFNEKKFYITSNNRFYSNGEILISNEKPLGVSSEERYSYTTHSIQGETAYNKLFIDIFRMFDERMFYTALSRAMYLEQIYLINRLKKL